MIHDGSYDAHYVDSDGNLKYDWKKDKRFEAYANNDTSNMAKYNKAKGLYFTVGRQLIQEGATNEDGTKFVFSTDDNNPTPLPKAYSNRESEAKKAVGDSMYGYYDSTKKSLMQATMIGGLMMQMKTYWSAKKNQYFAPGGIKSQGKWVQMEDPTIDKNVEGFVEGSQYLYYSKNENGNIDKNGPFVHKGDENCSNVPVLQWKGKFEEGVVVTVANMLKDSFGENRSFKQAWNERWNNADEDL